MLRRSHASLILPFLLFAFASWTSYRSFQALTDERLARSLDVEQEEASKTFQLVVLALDSVSDLVAGMSDLDIAQDQERLYPRLQKLVRAIPALQSIWIYGKDGGVLVSSWVYPPPKDNFSGRDFFLVHVKGDVETYYGQVYESIFGAQPFFTVSRRLTLDGQFVGVLEVSVLQSNFFRFYTTLAYSEGLQYALLRNDGVILARYPAAPQGATQKLDENTGFRRTIAKNAQGGTYITTSPVDDIERNFAVRRLGQTPLYVSAGIAISTIRSRVDRWDGTSPHLWDTCNSRHVPDLVLGVAQNTTSLCRGPGQYVRIAVTDTGSGMTKEVISRAFEPFFTTKQSGQGTGLGLSQVYGFVKQSGGHVKIYSEVGEGTTIKIYLPRFIGEASIQEERKSEPRRGRSGECILVVEDDAHVRAYVAETLGALGYDVLEAANGKEALRLLTEHNTVSLVLTDVVMPGMNGRKLAEEARQRQPALKFLYMTGYSRNAIVHQGRLDPGVAADSKAAYERATVQFCSTDTRHLV